ncbi:MAG: YIP1 family protein [Candidatus Omnitrophota bacterium]|nr:YIP1 family protein [Candidatus Omnitrophota bacterium]MDZ4242257.1 YIP1 family protein [Candidatus Omnitrophota bacterium]
MDSIPQSPSSVPDPIEPQSAPLVPRNILLLYFKPREFFARQIALGKTPYLIFVGWVLGMTHVIDKIDQNMLRADMGQPRPGWEQIGPVLTGSWVNLWACLLIFGALAGYVTWLVGGWWFEVRLKWCGAQKPDAKLARTVYIYASFIYALPNILLLLYYTVAFPNYAAAWAGDELWSLLVVIFSFWACVTGYKGATTAFEVRRWPARIWFMILPMVALVIFIGGLGLLYAIMTGGGAE